MEIASTSLLITVVLVILTCAWRVVNWVWLQPKRLEKILRNQGLAGNSYWILFGDMKETSTLMKQARSQPMNFSHDIAPHAVPFTHKIVTTYGKNSFTWLGPIPRVHIMEPELMNTIFAKINEFPKPGLNPLFKLLVTGLAAYNGEKWTKHRKMINPAFQVEKLKVMLPAFYQSVFGMISNWETLISDQDGLSCELDVFPYLQTLSSDAISRTAFGSSFKEGKRIFQLLNEQTHLISTQVVLRVYIPGWRFLPTKMNRKMKEIDRKVRGLLRGIINKRERAIKAGEVVGNDDLLGILLQSNLKEIQENGNSKNVGMSMRDVIEECKLFYFAGQETTSVLLVWTMVLLSKHQEWQDRARAEVLQAFGKNKPEFDGLNHLKVVNMILYEVLRLYPPVVMLSRKVRKETRLGKLTLPAGVAVALPTMLIHHDRELWGEDANEFKPERFAEGISKATKNQLSFFPFGWGPRFCIGQNFAMMEAKLALSMILQRFSFELSPSYAHAPVVFVTLQPQHGAHIFLRKL